MAFIKFKHTGGPVTVSPILAGPMNCGYSIDAYVAGSTTPFKSVQGTMENIKSLIFDDASMIAEKTVIMGTFQFRAGNDALVGSNYKIGLKGVQDGGDLVAESSKIGQLPAAVATSQVSAILISEATISELTS